MTRNSANSHEGRDPFALAERVRPLPTEENPNPGAARVVDLPDEPAGEFYIAALGETVAEAANAPEDDPTVTVVFEADLDRYVPEWHKWAQWSIPERLERYEREWNVSVTRYTYAASRLEPAGPRCDECGVTKRYVNEPVISGYRGYVCVNEECMMDQ